MLFDEMKRSEPVVVLENEKYTLTNGVYKSLNMHMSEHQEQTQNTFGFKWQKQDTFNSIQNLERMKEWLLQRYKSPQEWLSTLECDMPIILDAGCGAGMSGFEYWGEHMHHIQYIGVDVSEAVEVAYERAQAQSFTSPIFIQESISELPFTAPVFDIIFSEGVLHHTDSTQETFSHLSQFLKPNGLFMFYVYRQKGPIREFTDDYIRKRIAKLSPNETWDELEALTAFGIELGKLNLEIDVPKEINVLDIPAGKINLQRFFYWHIFKAFYDPNLSFDEMHHINFDWYAPQNAHRHTVSEVHTWCDENNLSIEHLIEEPSGITCVARKQ